MPLPYPFSCDEDEPKGYIPTAIIGFPSTVSLTNESSIAKVNFEKLRNLQRGLTVDSQVFRLKDDISNSILHKIASEDTLNNFKHDHEALSNMLFPDDLFAEFLMNGQKVFETKYSQSDSETKIDVNYSTEHDGFLSLLLFYMKSVLVGSLKSDFSISLAQMEFFQMVSTPNENDFLQDFYKIVFMTSSSVITMMKELYSKTGYIYPVSLPSLHRADTLYRASMTTVLPNALYHYLHFQPLECGLDLTKINEFYEQLKNENTTPEVEENKKEFDDKLKTLKDYFPSFLGKNVVIENSVVDLNKVKYRTGDDIPVWVNMVNSIEDIKQLLKSCLLITKTIFEIVKWYHNEMDSNSSFKEPSFLACVKPIPLLFKEYRFKKLYENINSVYIVEKLSPTGKWEILEVVKKCNDYIGYTRESGCSGSRTSHGWLIINPFYQPVQHVSQSESRNTLHGMATELYQTLHSKQLVHSDLKPDVVLDSSRKSGFRFLDFEYTVGECCFVLGCTKGFHPPEYDCMVNEEGIAFTRMEGDVYSLGLCMLHFMFGCGSIERSEIPYYVNQVEDSCLKTVLNKMFEEDLRKRLSNAKQIIDLLDQLSQVN